MTIAQHLISLARYGQARCGSGFGKYPLGILDAIEQLLPLVPDTERAEVDAALNKFKDRLNQ